jgi:hypothetical protein
MQCNAQQNSNSRIAWKEYGHSPRAMYLLCIERIHQSNEFMQVISGEVSILHTIWLQSLQHTSKSTLIKIKPSWLGFFGMYR